MLTKILLSVAMLAIAGTAYAQISERTEPIAPNSQFVAVDLNALANDGSTPVATSSAVAIQKIPFELAHSGDKNNLFLKNAGWPDWEKDPLSFYSTYDNAPVSPTDALPVVQIPTDDYSAVWVLASCENDAQFSNVLSLRIGAKKRAAQTTYRDYEFQIPRANEKTGTNVVRALPGENGNLFLMRLPLGAALSQDFSNQRTLDVEITKQIRLAVAKPDAARFQLMPLGLPSGVHLCGMTFERAPIRLQMRAAEIGNIFNEPQTPSFVVEAMRTDDTRLPNLTVRARVTDYYGATQNFPALELAAAPPAALAAFRRTLQLPVKKRGYYVLNISVESDGKVLLEKQTTFALLPKDTRAHRASSPFGTWDFGGTHYTPADAEIVGPLYVKAGLRYGMFNASPQERARYGVLKGNDPKVNARSDLSKLDEQIAAIKASGEIPTRWLLFHEGAISGDHITRTPDLFTGKKYQLNEAEQKKLDEMIHIIRVTVPKVRAAFPGIKFYLGNGGPQLMEEFLRHQLSPDLFDVLGNEAAAFQRLPESQPTDFVANNASLWMEHELLKAYGYENKSVEQGYEITYPSSNPGNMTLRGQANYVVRNAMHSLAWKVPAIRFEGIADPGNSYYFSNWGATGLMFGRPDLSPKPLYVATATMTQLLDGAKFSRMIPTGTTTVYAFEFQKPDGEFVTCVWTPNAPRKIKLQSSQSQLKATDLMFNAEVLPASGELTARPDPVFIESEKPLQIQILTPSEAASPQREYSVISKLDDANQWQLRNGEDDELEAYNFMQPRRDGEFAMRNVAEFDGRKNVLEVKPPQSENEDWWLPRYTKLVPQTPLEIQGQPTHIGVSVNGNGGWGRIIFEMEDAAGQRWISLGTEAKGEPNPWLADWMSKAEFEKLKSESGGSAGVSDWNSNDVWGRSVINFAGWNTIQFPLPGNYAGEGYHWPYTSQWRCVKADGTRGDYIVHYPLKLTKLVVTARSKVLYGTKVEPVRRAEIYLQDLGVAYDDPDKDFWQPDLGQR
jgi:hypothetical protein